MSTEDQKRTEGQQCEWCATTPAAGPCCSSHNKNLCHRCYRRTHFVEVCSKDCHLCAAEGLAVSLTPKRRERVHEGEFRPAAPGETPGQVEPDDGRPQPIDVTDAGRAALTHPA